MRWNQGDVQTFLACAAVLNETSRKPSANAIRDLRPANDDKALPKAA